jgi:hypothetical protein
MFPEHCEGMYKLDAVWTRRVNGGGLLNCRLPNSALLSAESKGEPSLKEAKSADFRIREDLMKLVQVWDSLSEGTKVYLQMHCDHEGYVSLWSSL